MQYFFISIPHMKNSNSKQKKYTIKKNERIKREQTFQKTDKMINLPKHVKRQDID